MPKYEAWSSRSGERAEMQSSFHANDDEAALEHFKGIGDNPALAWDQVQLFRIGTRMEEVEYKEQCLKTVREHPMD